MTQAPTPGPLSAQEALELIADGWDVIESSGSMGEMTLQAPEHWDEPGPREQLFAFRLAPTAPVEASWSELLPCPFCGGEAEIVHLDDGDNVGGSCVCCTKCQASGNVEFGRKENFVENWNRRAALRPQPSGETREVVLKGVGKVNGDGWKDTTTEGEIVFVWNVEKPTPYAPGQYPRVGNEGWSASTSQYNFTPATADDVPAILALLSTSPLALGGQHSGGEVVHTMTLSLTDAEMKALEALMKAKDLSAPAVFRNSFRLYQAADAGLATVNWPKDTTPARAEAQDEGAAGEPVGPPREPTQSMMDALLYHSSHDTTWADAYTMWTNAHDAWFRDGDTAHPSPTPAADADRVRIAVEAFNAKINAPLTGPTHGAWDRGRIAGLKEALAALKSTAAKEGEEA